MARRNNWDRLPSTVGDVGATMLRQFRADLEAVFRSRLIALALFGARTRGDRSPGDPWDVAATVQDFDSVGDLEALSSAALPYRDRGYTIAAVGLSEASGRGDFSALRRAVDRDGIPISGPGGMTFLEFCLWERDQPLLHELVDGQPIEMAVQRQETRKLLRARQAAWIAHGQDERAAKKWLQTHNIVLDGMPKEIAPRSWRDLVRVLRLLEEAWPGCTRYDPEMSFVWLQPRWDNLLTEAEHFAAIEARS